MNSKRIFIAGMAFAVLWQGVKAASNGLRTDASYREAYAARYSSDTVTFSTAGLQSKTLIISTFPPDTARCSQSLDEVAADAAFVDGLSKLGFTAVECFSYSDDFHITGSETRKITPRKPAAPFKPLHHYKYEDA
jgi:hypothetical protein